MTAIGTLILAALAAITAAGVGCIAYALTRAIRDYRRRKRLSTPKYIYRL